MTMLNRFMEVKRSESGGLMFSAEGIKHLLLSKLEMIKLTLYLQAIQAEEQEVAECMKSIDEFVDAPVNWALCAHEASHIAGDGYPLLDSNLDPMFPDCEYCLMEF